MSRLIILITLGVVAWLIYKLYYQKLRQQGKPGMIKLGLIAVGLIFMALAVTGRAHVAFALLGAAMTQVMRIMPLLVRFFPAIQQIFNSSRPFGGSAGQQSSIRTKILSVSLDHNSGKIEGEVTGGQFEGQSLGNLSREQLSALLQECSQCDPEGVRLLQAYISRSFGDSAGGHSSGSESGQAQNNGAVPEPAEAREILGVGQHADRDEIIASHRRLMGKMHPDKGGSTYLAAKINAAKEVLLEELKSQHS